MEFKLNEVSKISSFTPNLVLYRINDEIYDEINYTDNMFYIIRRCGVTKWTKNHNYTTYVTDKNIIIYPLEQSQIYEEYFQYDEILKTTPEISSISISGGIVKEDKIDVSLSPEYREYVDIFHGSNINIDTSNWNYEKDSYVYKIKNNYPHELVKSTFIKDNQSNPTVEINGKSSQNGIPTIDNPVEFGHVGEGIEGNYRISVGQNIKLNDLNSLANIWYLAQYNTKDYNNIKAINKLTPSGITYLDDGLLMNQNPLHTVIEEFPLDVFYTVYAKAYVWCEEECIIPIGSYVSQASALWVNGRRIAYGSYWNSNRPFQIQFKKGQNLIELTSYRDASNGGYFYLKGNVNGVYTEGAQVTSYDGISFLTYHNKYLKNVLTKDNEDFYFMSPIQLKSFGDIHDTYNFSESESTITQRVQETKINSFTDFVDEDAENVYSIASPIEIDEEQISFNFNETFEELEYVMSNGIDWYNTGIELSSENVQFKIKFELTQNIPGGKALFGSCKSTNTEWLMQYFNSQNKMELYLGTNTRLRADTLSLNTIYDYSISTDENGTYRQLFNGALSSGTYKDSIQNGENNCIEIFRYPTSNDPNSKIPSGIKLYETELYLNGVLVQKLIPVKRKSDNVEGVYDKARNIFHYGAGLNQSYVEGNVEILSNKFDGIEYMLLGSTENDTIAYHNGRLYFYTTKDSETLQNTLNNGISLLYKLTTPNIIQVSNPTDVYNNIYEETEDINVLPAANALTNWKNSYNGVTVSDNGDGSFNIHYANQKETDSSLRGIYKEFSVENGKSYTVSFSAMGNFSVRICDSNSSSPRWTVATKRNTIAYERCSLTFTADRTNFRIYIYQYYEKDAIIKDLKITQNDYVPSYIVTDSNGETASVSLDYSMSYTYSTNSELIEVENGHTYKFSRPNSGDVWQIRYRDKNKKIIGYSEYLDTSITEISLEIPNNCFYVEFMDGNNLSSGYSIILDEQLDLNPVVSSLHYIKGNEQIEIELPHALNPGDEFIYDAYYKEWVYYPLSLNDDFIVYTIEEFPALLLNGVSHVGVQNPISLTLVVNKKEVRELTRPTIISLTDAQDSGHGFGYVEWEEVIGANEYKIYIGDSIIDTIDNVIDNKVFRYEIEEENQGVMHIIASNSKTSSNESYGFNIYTVPNTPIVKFLDTVYENNRYYVTVEFDVNSKLVDSYNLSYSIDGAAPVVTNLEGNKVGLEGQIRKYSFTVANISTGINVNIYAINETGVNNYMPTSSYQTVNGFTKWTYKKTLKQVLLAWNDEFNSEDKYLIKYSLNNGEWLIAETDKGVGSGRQLLEYLSMTETDEMRVCITPVINGQRQIFTKPIKVSKALDKTLIPPDNFSGVKVRNGLIQFSWDDNYGIADTRFELYYKYSDGTSQTISIAHAANGDSAYTYRINTDTYGFANAKIKMIWELGESDYSEELTIYDLPDADAPPDMYHQRRSNGGKVLLITWSPFDFIKEYTLNLVVNGIQKTITCYDPQYEYEIPQDIDKISISASVKATNIGGEFTSYSDEITFTVCNSDYRKSQTVYVHAEEDKDIITTIVGSGLITPYYLYTLSKNNFDRYYPIYDKSIKPYLESEYRFEDNYWGHNIGGYGLLGSWISNKIKQSSDLYTVVYQNVMEDIPFRYNIYSKVSSEYRLYSEFTKVVIACLGDSITAGHPQFWAETGTGDITSQYEYWLSRRLKGEYDVVNKGYGQEKLVDMVERFDRDIVPLNPKYCILHGGTNDYVKTYIVRCSWKLCNECF